MLDLQLPSRHDWAVQDRTYGKLVMEDLTGYAHRHFANTTSRCVGAAVHFIDDAKWIWTYLKGDFSGLE